MNLVHFLVRQGSKIKKVLYSTESITEDQNNFLIGAKNELEYKKIQ